MTKRLLSALFIISMGLVGFSQTATSASFWTQTASGQEIHSAQSSDSLGSPLTVLPPLDPKNETLATDIVLAPDESSLVALSGPEGTLVDVIDTEEITTIEEQTLYTVRAGDTLAQVAQLFDIKTDTIQSANKLVKGRELRPGTRLIIPATDGIPYTVLAGDTIQSIAKKFKIENHQDIIEYNLLLDETDLRKGQEIFIPGGKALIVPTPAKGKSTKSSVRSASSSKNIKFNGTFIKPASGPLTSGYGMRWGKMHTGIDIGAPSGTPIYAAASGTVRQAKRGNGYGNMVVISHGNGIETLYAHMSQIATSAGAHVNQGDLIGYVGSTGYSTGPHLHLEFRQNGTPVNPSQFLN